MKYGNIIYDSESDDAKALIGAKVLYSNIYSHIKNLCGDYGVLYALNSDKDKPFIIGGKGYAFVREIIEEKPKYRPYKNADEMIEDFRARFNIKPIEGTLPMIWVKYKNGDDGYRSITDLYKDIVYSTTDYFDYKELLETFTYLDGSPVGKEE